MPTEVEQIYSTAKAYAESGSAEQAKAIVANERLKLATRSILTQDQEQIAHIRDQIDLIYRSETMTPEQKARRWTNY